MGKVNWKYLVEGQAVEREVSVLLVTHPQLGLLYRVHEWCRGRACLGGKEYDVALWPGDHRPTYGIDASTKILIDLNGDGVFQRETTIDEDGNYIMAEERDIRTPFTVDGCAYEVIQIASDGSWVEIGSSDIEEAASIGFAAPDFAAETMDGKEIRLKAYRGKAVVLNFWSMTCGVSRGAIPALNDLADTYAGRDVVFISIACEFAEKDEVRDVLDEQPFHYIRH